MGLLGIGAILEKSEGSLGVVRIGVSVDRGIGIYNFIELYTIDLVFSILLISKCLPQETQGCYHIGARSNIGLHCYMLGYI